MNKVALVILDGVGFTDDKNSPIYRAKMKNYFSLINDNSKLICASGECVGLEKNTAGNSEVGHNTIGSGKIISQGIKLINNAFKTGEIFKSKMWKNLISNSKKSALHFIGLLSDGDVHSNFNQLKQIIKKANDENVEKVYIHALLDGRDVAPRSAIEYISDIQLFLNKTNKNYKLVDFAGRNKLVMDRYNANTDIVKNAFNVYVNRIGNFSSSATKTILEIYKQNNEITDQEIEPYILDENIKISNGDSVVLFNFRGDRAVEISQLFEKGKYISKNEFLKINKCKFFGLTQFDFEQNIPKNYLISNAKIKSTLTHYLCKKQIKQYSVAETQKFGHITYYFNGNRLNKISEDLETWEKVESDKNITFDKKPKMKANKITKKFCMQLDKNKFDFYKINFANGDMVGHTGNEKAVIKSLKTVDSCLGKIIKSANKNNVVLLVVSDHGNCEKMKNADGSVNTSHTNHPVWFCLKNNRETRFKIKKGTFGLSNVANSVCVCLGIDENKNFNKSIVE